ncbi:hypothetical protein [Catellatospora citrea]|uniref:Uncharacterized protein n=1 Tax=Catellatospora citrea TaxID=53366 RepID=A0A8J3KK52_9ACTN|nr:hypothetical protein [Catellatospora citrea]RKE08124.1 hypothetical protein C8E86_2968 [Catellatospora citrea]GIF98505.1 hypothetical protein Cci01nite_35990 [Catellatospora citrea]
MKQLLTQVRDLGRITGGPLLVRGVVFVAAFTGLLLAAPGGLPARMMLGFLALAAVPAIAPGGVAVTLVMLATVAMWLADTMLFLAEPSTGRLLGTAAALYLLHNAAALAAVLPYDAIVDNQVLLRWAVRSALVLGAAGGLTIVLMTVLPGMYITTPTVALVVGLAVVAAAVALLTRLGKRP